MGKILFYFILIIAFLMFYQQNPAACVVIVVVLIGGYLYIKSRKRQGHGTRNGGFFKGRGAYQSDQVKDLATLIMLQQLMAPNKYAFSTEQSDLVDKEQNKREAKIEKTKCEVLELLRS